MATMNGRRPGAPVKIPKAIPAIPASLVAEIRTILNELIGARNVAATVCMALPTVYLHRCHWELADTLYNCTVRVLDRQIQRLTTLLGEKPKRRRRGAK